LETGLRAVPRPNPLTLLWRWRYEAALLAGVPLAVWGGLRAVGVAATLLVAAALIATGLLWPPARRWLAARAWCVITPHRVRTACAEARIHSRRGKIPVVLLTTRQPFGERVHLWLRAGTCAEDVETARQVFRAACWATDVRVGGSARHAHLVFVDVVRADTDPDPVTARMLRHAPPAEGAPPHGRRSYRRLPGPLADPPARGEPQPEDPPHPLAAP
jgi:hypothetical protein